MRLTDPGRRQVKVAGPSLSPRLSMVADLLMPGSRLIDIGTDHAYLPIHAIRNGLFQEAIAIDVRTGPLAVAARNIRRYGLEDHIRTVLSDGLAVMTMQTGDVVLMAGLGGLEMIDILKAAPARWPRLVLQPQKSVDDLRHYLFSAGYRIDRESLCLDDRRLYLGLVAQMSGQAVMASEAEVTIGPCLMQEHPPFYQHWLEKTRVQVRHAIRRGEDKKAVLDVIDQELDSLRRQA